MHMRRFPVTINLKPVVNRHGKSDRLQQKREKAGAVFPNNPQIHPAKKGHYSSLSRLMLIL
jgi:hypothetical protein